MCLLEWSSRCWTRAKVAEGEVSVRLEPALHPLDPELLPLEAGGLAGLPRPGMNALPDSPLLVLLPLLDPPGCRRDRNRHREGYGKELSQGLSSSSLHSFPKRDEN